MSLDKAIEHNKEKRKQYEDGSAYAQGALELSKIVQSVSIV